MEQTALENMAIAAYKQNEKDRNSINSSEWDDDELEPDGSPIFRPSPHVHEICIGCVKKAAKWGAILYAAHWTLHIIIFVVNPVLGAWFLALF